MSEKFQSLEFNHLNLHVLSTKKYKTNQLAVYIRQPLEEENYTKVALLPAILKRGTQAYPSAQKIGQALDDLYGASLQVDVQKRGEQQIIIFRLQMANEKYLKDKTPLLEKGIHLLSQVLTQPLLEEGVFAQKFVDLEKDLLKRKLTQLKDDKIRYANKRCVEEMFRGERFSLFANGSVDRLEDIDPRDLYAYYQQMLTSHPIDIFVVGDVEKNEVEQLCKQQLQLKRTHPISMPASNIAEKMVQEQKVLEKTKITQGKLHIGCRTKTRYADQDYVALVVCNGVLGGFSHSKLFRNVREKESLAYYVNSSIESHQGLLMIMSGIDFNHYQQTIEIIKEQLELMKQGEVTTEEMEQTKAVLINQLKESKDQPFQTIERFYHGIIGGLERPTDEVIKAIEQVTIQEVHQVAQKITVDTIYFLTTEEEQQGVIG